MTNPIETSYANVVTEQLTAAGRAIEHDSFSIIDREVGPHAYASEQWPVVRRMIHANADFEFNGLTRFHPDAVETALRAILAHSTRLVADVEMICVGLSQPRLQHFGLGTQIAAHLAIPVSAGVLKLGYVMRLASTEAIERLTAQR